jgi:hypothetical protein
MLLLLLLLLGQWLHDATSRQRHSTLCAQLLLLLLWRLACASLIPRHPTRRHILVLLLLQRLLLLVPQLRQLLLQLWLCGSCWHHSSCSGIEWRHGVQHTCAEGWD